jgi:hypothetical protein
MGLSVRLFQGAGLLAAGTRRSGSVRRWPTSTSLLEYVVAWEISADDGAGTLALRHRGVPEGQAFVLATTRPVVGGTRWWFTCPCGRRVGKVYLPAGADRFACRTCHNLTYRTRQMSRCRADATVEEG